MHLSWNLSFFLVFIAAVMAALQSPTDRPLNQQFILQERNLQMCQSAFPDRDFKIEHFNNMYDDNSPRPFDPMWLPTGFYDALERPISKEEYDRQAEYERRTGLPYHRDREDEQKRKTAPLLVKAFQEHSCSGEHPAQLTETETCLTVPKGVAFQVESISSLCAIWIYADEKCWIDPFEVLDALSGAEGCFSPGDFGSLEVVCSDELPA
jgi:hypothetical protein